LSLLFCATPPKTGGKDDCEAPQNGNHKYCNGFTWMTDKFKDYCKSVGRNPMCRLWDVSTMSHGNQALYMEAMQICAKPFGWFHPAR
jgi:hypothetical protein